MTSRPPRPPRVLINPGFFRRRRPPPLAARRAGSDAARAASNQRARRRAPSLSLCPPPPAAAAAAAAAPPRRGEGRAAARRRERQIEERERGEEGKGEERDGTARAEAGPRPSRCTGRRRAHSGASDSPRGSGSTVGGAGGVCGGCWHRRGYGVSGERTARCAVGAPWAARSRPACGPVPAPGRGVGPSRSPLRAAARVRVCGTAPLLNVRVMGTASDKTSY